MKKITQLSFFLFINILLSQTKDYEIVNTAINSKYAEIGVTYLNDNSFIFASSKKVEGDKSFKKDRRRNNKQLHLELYRAESTENGDVIQLGRFTSDANNKIFESDISFTPDFKTVYFTWNNYYNTKKRKDSARWKTLKIVKATINENFEITNVETLPFSSSKYSIRCPEVSKDGKKLFFVSDMPGGYGETDIYVVDILSNGTYSTPKNLGPAVNTSKAEFFPFVDSNNVLYFSSFGHKGKGRLDIFKSEFKDNRYQKAENLPAPFNSASDDFAFVINSNTDTGFFTSTRKGKGDADIFAFKPKHKKCEQLLSGTIINKITSKNIAQVTISLQLNNKVLKSEIANNGRFNFKLKCNNTYKIVAQKENFIPSEIEITTSSKKKHISPKIKLMPIKCVQYVTGKVLDAKTQEPLSAATVVIFKNNAPLDSILLNKNAEFKYELDCKAEYKITASLKDYSKNETYIYTSNIPKTVHKKTLLLTPSVEFVTVKEQKMIKTNPIYFGLDSDKVLLDAAIELDKVVAILKKYPTIKIEIKSHTDSRAPDNYNLKLSNKRAIATINYIVSKGIDPSRVSGKGYGETQLINKCKNGVRCTETEHRMNRRTEFIVIEE